ncbi:MAG TPA: amidohydrolase family protein, partial [Anseongella sp.]|nr:amidohydrolase family protein [Anseongella sp.]
FDGFTRIGLDRSIHPAAQWRLSQLLEELDHCSISGALVASAQSLNYDLLHANLELSAAIKPYPRLFAIWNVMPHQTGEFPGPEELGKLMQQHNVPALSIHPQTNAWDWKAHHCAALFEWLSKNRVLTIVTSAELGGWPDVGEFLERYPELPVLLINASWSEQRYLLPLLTEHRNLHISFNNFQINEGIEFLHEKGCTEQMIFASNAPAMSAGAHRCYIDYAAIPEEARAKVAGGNLLRLLGIGKPAPRRNPQEDALMTAARQGLPLPVPVLDMHMHILDEGLNGAGKHYRMENGGPSGVFPLVKRLGYQGGGIMSWNGVVSYDAASGNVTTRKALDAAPQGYWGLATFDPTHYSQEELRKMIPEVYADKRFIGMKPYGLYGLEYHDPLYDSWWEYGNQHKFYALIHNSRSDLLEVETLAGKYPDVRWVIAHAAGSFRMA